jgi:hypothetical protein
MYKCNCGREFKIKQHYNMHKKYCKGPRYCQNPECSKLLVHYQKKFCSTTCSSKITAKGRIHTIETRQKISRSNGGDGNIITSKKYCLFCNKPILSRNTYCSNKCHNDYIYKCSVKKWLKGEISGAAQGGASAFIKRYLRETYGNKCSLCGWCEINPVTNNVPIELDHIDGNHKNNEPENVRLLCPNCHSLTSTYKALNTGNGRKYRRNIPL